MRQRHEPLLPGEAQREHVGRQRRAQQFARDAAGVHEMGGLARRLANGFLDAGGGQGKIGVAGEVAGIGLRHVHDHAGMAVAHGGQHLLHAGDHEVAAQHQISLPRRDADGVDILRAASDLHMAEDRPALLGDAGHVDDARALAFQMGRHA